MKKLIKRMYGVACILFIFLFFYGLINLRINIDRKDSIREYTEIINYSISEVNDATAPRGIKKVIRFRLKDIEGDYNTLMFLTKHQNVKVMIGSDVIYELKSNHQMLCPKSPGVVYNDIVLRQGYDKREIVIELAPFYEEINPTPRIRIGAGSKIISGIIFENLPIMIFCIIVIAMGFVQFLVALMNRKREDFGFQPAVCHALGIMLGGFWKIFDSNLVALQAQKFPFFPILAFLIFMLMPLMITKVVKDQLTTEKLMPFMISDLIAVCSIFILIFLQLLGIMDFWDGMWIVRACEVIAFLCVLLVIWREVREDGWTRNNITAALVASFAAVWVIVELITYYVAGGVTEAPFGMLLFVIFLTILLFNRMQISRKGMEEGMQAVQYQKLAFHDALTGFFNRAAFMDYISGPEFLPERNIMLAFDLNNLKKCNDELGHDKGDQYIKESAAIIMDCFGEGGRCYRLGGDEFSAILNKTDIEDCERRIKLMRERVERFNQDSEDIHMGIACGYAIFDPKEDEDIHATIRRADKMMYEVKFAMKQGKL